VQVTGNTVIDALLEVVARLEANQALRAGLERQVCACGLQESLPG